MNEVSTKHITELIEEPLQRRVRNTIQEYANKNAQAFAENRIAGIEWSLGLTVLGDNLGLNPLPKPKTLWHRFTSIASQFRRWFSARLPHPQ